MYEHLSIEEDVVVCVQRHDMCWGEEFVEDIAPMIFKHGGGQKKTSMYNILEDVDPFTYVENRRALGKIFGWTEGDWIELFEEQVDHRVCSLGDFLAEKVESEIQHNSENIDLLEEVATVLDVVCVKITGHGYSQGDYIEALAFANADYLKNRFGNITVDSKTIKEEMTLDGKMYVAWAFGDVYDVRLHNVPKNFDASRLEEEDLETLLDEADSDWDFGYDSINSMTIVEQMPDFESHPDIMNLIHDTKRVFA